MRRSGRQCQSELKQALVRMSIACTPVNCVCHKLHGFEVCKRASGLFGAHVIVEGTGSCSQSIRGEGPVSSCVAGRLGSLRELSACFGCFQSAGRTTRTTGMSVRLRAPVACAAPCQHTGRPVSARWTVSNVTAQLSIPLAGRTDQRLGPHGRPTPRSSGCRGYRRPTTVSLSFRCLHSVLAPSRLQPLSPFAGPCRAPRTHGTRGGNAKTGKGG